MLLNVSLLEFNLYRYMYIMLLLLINCFLLTIVCSGRICKKQTGNRHEYFCCENFERRDDGKCIECQIGFFSAVDSPCVPCQANTFGKRCADVCVCLPDQRCDNVKGCMMSKVTSGLSTEYPFKNKAIETTATNIESSLKSKMTIEEEHFTETCRSSVKVVISALVGLLMGGGVGVIFMFSKQVIKRNKRQDPIIAETNALFEIQGETINAYEKIDDITLESSDANINQNEENSDTSSNSINTEQRSENNHNTDYLNPYQPIISTTDPHLYLTTVTSTECSNTDPQATAVDSSSFSNDDKTDGLGRNDIGSRISRQLKYVELEINTTMSEANKVTDKYVNTHIYENQPTENKHRYRKHNILK